MTFVPFPEANRIADTFLDLLTNRKITPARGGRLEDEFLSVTQLLEIWKDPQRAQGSPNKDEVIRNAAGVHDFAAKVL